MDNPFYGTGNLIIDGTRCNDCIHIKVCFYSKEGKRPRMERKTVNAFGTTYTKARCEHFRDD